MLLQLATLAALGGIAQSLNVPSLAKIESTSSDLAATGGPVEIAPPTWACNVRAWVRAPDLSANLRASGDARLVLNGTDCVDVIRWHVGLRLKERSIVRVPASGVEVPVMPPRNFTALHGSPDWRGRDAIWDVGTSERRPDVSSPYFAEMAKHDARMQNHSLWEVEGRERLVFDSRLELSSAIGDASLPLAAVKSFKIAVPNISLPPSSMSSGGTIWHTRSGTVPEFTVTENQFTYYFSLTLRNGTSLELPAGLTRFVPVGSVSDSDNNVARDPLLVVAKLLTERQWSRRRPSACNMDNTTIFETHIDLPPGDVVFRPGSFVLLNTTIIRVGNSSIAPTYISINPSTELEQTWAATFGRSLQQKLVLRGADQGRGSHTTEGVRVVKSRKEEQAEADSFEEDGGFCSPHDFGSAAKREFGGTELRNTTIQSVLVNFTVPANILPTFQATFKDYRTYLKVRVHAVQPCPEDSAVEIKLFDESDDIHNDHLWSSATLWDRRQRSNNRRSRGPREEAVFQGNTTIHVHAPLPIDHSSHPIATHYLIPNTPAPKLLAMDSEGTEATLVFETMGDELRKETEEELQRSRYDEWSLKPVHRWHALGDGAFEHAGQVWARKLRREQDALEERVLLEGFQIQDLL